MQKKHKKSCLKDKCTKIKNYFNFKNNKIFLYYNNKKTDPN